MEKLGGKAAGDEIVDGYIQVLAAVPGYPYAITTTPAGAAGTESAPLGLRVDDQQLLDMNAYLQGLAAPAGVLADAGSRMRGKAMFRTTCTSATTWDQGRLCLTSSSP